MPTQGTNHKCPSCTGPLHFVGASGKLACDFCGMAYGVAARKHTKLRRALALLLTLVLALSLTACGSEQNDPQDGSGKLDTTKTEADASLGADGAEQSLSEEAQAALDDLFAHRQQELFAAAILGYREEGDTTDFTAWLHNESPALAAFWPFLTEIPEEDIIGDHGYLYCIVPLDENTSLTVKRVEWELSGNGATPHYSDPLYYGEVGKPFLLYTTCETWLEDSDVVVETVEEDGFVGTWGPSMEPEDGTLSNPSASHGGNLLLDFTHLYDVGDDIPRLNNSPDMEWLPPTDLGLANTTWYSDNGWLLEFGSGDMVLYQPVEDGEGTSLSPYYQGAWWMEDDSLCLEVYDGQCPFPLLISPSGEQLILMQADDGSVLPFFEPGQTTVGLTLSYG